MKFFLWIYAIVGSLYFVMYSLGVDVVARYAVGPLWLMMTAAPVVLGLLVLFPIAQRLGLFDN